MSLGDFIVDLLAGTVMLILVGIAAVLLVLVAFAFNALIGVLW